MDLKEILANNLRVRMAELGITKIEASNRSGVARPIITWLTNPSAPNWQSPTLITLEKLAKGLDTTVVDLLMARCE